MGWSAREARGGCWDGRAGCAAVLGQASERAALTLDLILAGVHPLQDGDAEGGGLASAILGSCQDVTAGQGDGDAFFLDRARVLKPFLVDAHEQLPARRAKQSVFVRRSEHSKGPCRYGSKDLLFPALTS